MIIQHISSDAIVSHNRRNINQWPLTFARFAYVYPFEAMMWATYSNAVRRSSAVKQTSTILPIPSFTSDLWWRRNCCHSVNLLLSIHFRIYLCQTGISMRSKVMERIKKRVLIAIDGVAQAQDLPRKAPGIIDRSSSANHVAQSDRSIQNYFSRAFQTSISIYWSNREQTLGKDAVKIIGVVCFPVLVEGDCCDIYELALIWFFVDYATSCSVHMTKWREIYQQCCV